jgi:hypothetical protein
VTSSLGRDTTELQLLAIEPAAAPAAAAASPPPSPGGGAVAAIHSETSAAAAAGDAGAPSSSSGSSSGPVVLKRLASSEKCDVGQVLVDKLQWLPLAAGFNYLRQEWTVRIAVQHNTIQHNALLCNAETRCRQKPDLSRSQRGVVHSWSPAKCCL